MSNAFKRISFLTGQVPGFADAAALQSSGIVAAHFKRSYSAAAARVNSLTASTSL
jgi:hypothetical protein